MNREEKLKLFDLMYPNSDDFHKKIFADIIDNKPIPAPKVKIPNNGDTIKGYRADAIMLDELL